MRLVLATLLSVGLLVSGISAAHSKALMAGSTSIVICSPKGVHEIVLGANGEPIRTTHHCFDCCPVAIDGLAVVWLDHVRPYGRLSVQASVVVLDAEVQVSLVARARAPPIVV